MPRRGKKVSLSSHSIKRHLCSMFQFFSKSHLNNFLNGCSKHLFCLHHFVSENCHHAAHGLVSRKSDQEERQNLHVVEFHVLIVKEIDHL